MIDNTATSIDTLSMSGVLIALSHCLTSVSQEGHVYYLMVLIHTVFVDPRKKKNVFTVSEVSGPFHR